VSEAGIPSSGSVAFNEWGRVSADGTVYVRTPDGERVVGSWQTDAPEDGLAFFARRFADLQTQVSLLEQRVASGATAPDAAAAAARRLDEQVASAAAVGDLQGLHARLEALGSTIEQRREERRAERAAAAQASQARKTAIVEEAEQIASSTDWRTGVGRFAELLEEWKQLPRLDRPSDDALWHRFSAARTGYMRARKAHLAEVAEQREAARQAKEQIVAEAERLATSSDWGPTSAAMRELMSRWKAAGRAPRQVEDELWARFRAAQDAFFTARQQVNAQRDAELGRNLQAKQELLVQAEALLPVRDPKAARSALRGLQERWGEVGRVPRESMREIDRRMRAVEEAVGAAVDDAWRRSNPEARRRAESTVSQLRESIDSLQRRAESAAAAGDERARGEAEEALRARREWLAQAERTLAEFGG
jgi:hypothetical protein